MGAHGPTLGGRLHCQLRKVKFPLNVSQSRVWHAGAGFECLLGMKRVWLHPLGRPHCSCADRSPNPVRSRVPCLANIRAATSLRRLQSHRLMHVDAWRLVSAAAMGDRYLTNIIFRSDIQ